MSYPQLSTVLFASAVVFVVSQIINYFLCLKVRPSYTPLSYVAYVSLQLENRIPPRDTLLGGPNVCMGLHSADVPLQPGFKLAMGVA